MTPSSPTPAPHDPRSNLARGESRPALPAAPGVRTDVNGLRIGYLDDDAGICTAMRLFAQRTFTGATITIVQDTSDASYSDLLRQLGKLDVLITDFDLANGKRGDTVVTELKKQNPNLVVVGVSGRDHTTEFAAAGVYQVVAKPYGRDALLQAVLNACNGLTSPCSAASVE